MKRGEQRGRLQQKPSAKKMSSSVAVVVMIVVVVVVVVAWAMLNKQQKLPFPVLLMK